MRHPRIRHGTGLAALRRERSSLAALGLLLLFAQLFLSGLGQGAMAAERLHAPDLTQLCQTLDGANAVRGGGVPPEPERSCPCLAGVCLVSAAALLPVDADAPGPALQARAREAAPLARNEVVSPRRPIDLFARASRGPPILV